jgi:hypothetical protein
MSESIPFTQYLRPLGRPTPVTIVRPLDVMQLADEVIAMDGQFSVEHLMTGQASFTVEHDDYPDEDVAHEIVSNGPPVLDAVDRLVRDAHRLLSGDRP